ncbi:hypothetical protein [Pontibacter litorisediminis]|uniref:hypothetical protein n=1 Tax=Pontibacter litorisediminis TaxID=1846260 RepID=UPI0023EACCA6|nr:hypothetical protein [Pontibacter litorisediminis]
MKKLILLVFLSCFSLISYSQTVFKPGYFIHNNGHRVDCLIKNTDKLTNPENFQYKLTEDSEIRTAVVNDVQEVEIFNSIHKYRRFIVEIDKSSNNTKDLDYSVEPKLAQEQLFLRVLVEGKASLYVYVGRRGLQRYFFTRENTTPEQLIYKKYLITATKASENTTYKQQLVSNLECQALTFQQLYNAAYQEKDLIEVFTAYNKCAGSAYTNYSDKKQRGKFQLTPKVGINSASLEVAQFEVVQQRMLGPLKESIVKEAATRFGPEQSARVGFEIERVFPFNNYKWSLYLGPTFQYFKTKGDLTVYKSVYVPETATHHAYVTLKSEDGTLTVDYSHISIPLGIKHHFFLSQETRLFLSGAVVSSILLNPSSSMKAENFETQPKFRQTSFNMKPSFLFSLGLKMKNNFNLEVDYSVGKRMLETNTWETSFKSSFSLILGYRLI